MIKEIVEVEEVTVPGMTRLPQIRDIFQINLGNDKNPRWIQFWTHPLRDKSDCAKAYDLIKTDGVGPMYSKESFARKFRVVPVLSDNYKEETFFNYRGIEFTTRYWEA
jgi:hypothetical protein